MKTQILNGINLFNGILLGLTILTKHTIGFIFSFAFFIYLLISTSKGNKIKTILRTFLPELFVGILFIIYLLCTNSFANFWDLCISGLFSFSNKNLSYSGEIIIIFFILLATFPLIFSYKKTKNKIDLLYFTFMISSFFLTFPLANSFHIIISFIMIFIMATRSIPIFFKDITLTKASKVSMYVATLTIITYFIVTLFYHDYAAYFFSNNYDSNKSYGDLAVYSGCYFNNNYFQDSTNRILKYIEYKESQGYNVYIISSDAAIYYIPLQLNHNKLDLVLNGNLGHANAQTIIDELEKIENPLILKSPLGEFNWQEPQEIEDYVIENYKYNNEKYETFRVFVKK